MERKRVLFGVTGILLGITLTGLPFKASGEEKKMDVSSLPALETAPTPGKTEASPSLAFPVVEDPNGTFFVLCYHRFLRKADRKGPLAKIEYEMPLEEFTWQMQYLKDNGFHPISQGQLNDYWFQGKPLPPKPVLITFDDGFRTVYRDAFPVVKSLDYPSILFLYTKFVEYGEAAMKRRAETGEKKKANLEVEALKDADISEMQKSGMVVEAHTANHLNLGLEHEKQDPAKYPQVLNFELTEPLTYIEANFNRKPEWLAYPYGVYDPVILKAVESTGYKLAFTVNPGPNDRTVPPLMLKRNLVLFPISHNKFAEIFQEKVLHIKGLTPGDGDQVDSEKPVISGQIQDDIVPKSIHLQDANKALKVQFDPKTRTVRFVPKFPLRQGGHILTLRATGAKGEKRVYNWYFRIKHKKYEKDGGEKEAKDAVEN